MCFMYLCVERRKQISLSSAHPHKQPCGFHGAVTGLDVSMFIFHSYLVRLLKAWARFFGQWHFEAVLSLVKEVCVVKNAPAQCPLGHGRYRGCCVAQGYEWKSLNPTACT